jgi:hypothetical protein
MPLTFRTSLDEDGGPRLVPHVVVGGRRLGALVGAVVALLRGRLPGALDDRGALRHRAPALPRRGRRVGPSTGRSRTTRSSPTTTRSSTHVGIGGWAGNIQGRAPPRAPDEGNPFEAPRQRLPLPAAARQRDRPHLPLRRARARPAPLPRADGDRHRTLPVDHGVSRPPCTYCTFCTGHGCWNASKSDTRRRCCPPPSGDGQLRAPPRRHVTAGQPPATAGWSASSTSTRSRARSTRAAGRRLLLGAYSFQNVRLLLHSGISATARSASSS